MGKTVLCSLTSLLLLPLAVAQDQDSAPAEVLDQNVQEQTEVPPEVTVRREGDNVVEEFRRNGRIFLIRVTPPNGQAYYLQDRGEEGEMEVSDQLDTQNEVSKWRVFQW